MASAGRSSSVVLLAVAAVFCVVVRALYAEATAENGHKTIDERVGGAPSVSAALRVRVVQFSRRVAPKKHTETAVELQERFKEAAEEARLGAAEAFLAYGSDSLVGTTFLVKTATEKSNQAIATEESLRNPLLRDAWRALLSACAVIESRSDAGTLLPHGPWRHPRRPVEAAFDALLQAELARACDGAEPPEAVLRAASVASGYAVALDAALMGLHMLQLQQVGVRTPAEQARVQTFVLKTLRLVQETKGQSLTLAPERHLVAFLTRELAPARERYAPAFYDALLAQWTSPGVADVLRARGLLKSAATHIQQDKPGGAEEEGEGAAASAAAASKGEAAAAGGARPQRRHPRHCTYCGVAPGPGQRDFQVCGGCSAVSYCCEAHCRKHWRAGHRGECAALKAAGAAPPATADG